jgi:hypothetical protein
MRLPAIIILIINYCLPGPAQELRFTRIFPSGKKLVPLAIVNNHPSYFHFLRYNRMAHDVTIERRSKATGDILAFTPLKLDSVNASWFDYENLDYLFFECNHTIYYVFEKVTIHKRELFMKTIDSVGRSSGFIPLLTLEMDRHTLDLDLEFKKVGAGKILVISSALYNNYTIRRVATCFDPANRLTLWTKKMPLENEYSGNAGNFECNEQGDLAYLMFRSRVFSFRRNVTGSQPETPQIFYDSLTVVSILKDGSLHETNTGVNSVTGLNGTALFVSDSSVNFSTQFVKAYDRKDSNVYFVNAQYSIDLQKKFYHTETPLSGTNYEKLTFYDGSDLDMAADKKYGLVNATRNGNYTYVLSARQEAGFYNEMVLCKTDASTGAVVSQEVIPRKISSKIESRFKRGWMPMQTICGNKFFVLVLESRQNFRKDPREFRFHKFDRLQSLSNANVVCYALKEGGLEKKTIYRNGDFDLIPLRYSSNQCDMVYYLNSHGVERFAFLKLSQL